MWTQPREYSLADLLEHPVLGLAMAGDGLDRRSLALLLDCEHQPEQDAERVSTVEQSLAAQI